MEMLTDDMMLMVDLRPKYQSVKMLLLWQCKFRKLELRIMIMLCHFSVLGKILRLHVPLFMTWLCYTSGTIQNEFKSKNVLQIWPWSNCLNKLRKTANLSFSVFFMEVKNAHITSHVFP